MGAIELKVLKELIILLKENGVVKFKNDKYELLIDSSITESAMGGIDLDKYPGVASHTSGPDRFENDINELYKRQI